MLEVKDKCPICDLKFETHNSRENYIYFACKHKCFTYEFDHGEITAYVFNKEFYLEDSFEVIIPYGVGKEVEYWTENDKYLINILTESREESE